VYDVTPLERILKTFHLINNEAENSFEFPLDGAYGKFILTFILNMTNSNGVPVFYEDGFFQYFKAVGVRLNGTILKFNMPLLFAWKKQTSDLGVQPFYQEPDTTDGAVYDVIAKLDINFAQDIFNENDVSALLQTGGLTNLELIIATGDKDDIASANAPVINSAKVEIEVREFRGGEINDPTKSKMLNISETVDEYKLEENRTSFENPQEIDLKSNTRIIEQAFLALDNNVPSNDLVTRLQYWIVESVTPIITKRFKTLVRETKSESELENTLNGFAKINMIKKFGSNGFRTGAKSKETLRLLTDGVDKSQDTILVYTKSV
jgi:hypothetical protein